MNIWIIGLLGMAAVAAANNLVQNGNFEQGAAHWTFAHNWYAKPPGAGLSEMLVVEGEGRQGSKALKFIGKGKRGIAMQVFPVYPGKYRVTGWMKCENLGSAQAKILCEWMSRDNKWLSGTDAGVISGTRDWTFFDAIVEAPAEARAVHFDLLTTDVNEGIVLFDDITMTREKSGFPPPQPPRITAETPPGQEGCLQISWDLQSLTQGAVQLLVYCEEKPLSQVPTPLPAGILDIDDKQALIDSLEVGKTYYLAARLINADGEASALGPQITAKVQDRQAPRPGWLWAERVGTDVIVEWAPHCLDMDVKRLRLVLPPAGEEAPKVVRILEARDRLAGKRPFYSFAGWLRETLKLPPEITKIGVQAEDLAGNRGEIGWTDIIPAAPAQPLSNVALWLAPPTESIPKTAEPPSATAPLEPRIMRGQAKGLQLVVRPAQQLHQARIVCRALRSPDGKQDASMWITAHFVNYVHLEKNSIATPKEELVWAAPADFPDELSEDRLRDLPAGQAQPIYLRIAVPKEAAPGLYEMEAQLLTHEGHARLPFRFRVEPVALPDPVRLPFVYWFSWGQTCQQFGVEARSADGWRVLYQLGRLMRAHHQRVVVVPWSLVRTWRGADGTLHHDFRLFDRFIRTMQAAGVNQLFCLSHMGARTTGEWECPTMSSHMHPVRELHTGRALASMDCVDLLPALQDHIERLGLLEKFCVHVADEPIPANVESYRELSARVKAAAPKLPRIDAIHVPDLRGSLEIWVPQLNYFEQWKEQYRQAQAAGYKVWIYVAWVPQGKYPNRMIDGGAIKPRILHWLNALEDTDGYLHWALNHWQYPLTSLNSPGDQYICWPSRRFIANSSLRYEAEREGLEDCELMFMLRDLFMKEKMTRAQAQARLEAIGRKAVRGAQDYTHSWQELEAVRGEMLDMLAHDGGKAK